VPKNKDLKDDSSCISQQEGDVGFGDYIEAFSFDDKSEKEEMMKMEQDFVDSNHEEKAWVLSPCTSLDKKDTSHDEKKAPITGSSTQIPKFVGTFIIF
jgi:hypothetical protein